MRPRVYGGCLWKSNTFSSCSELRTNRPVVVQMNNAQLVHGDLVLHRHPDKICQTPQRIGDRNLVGGEPSHSDLILSRHRDEYDFCERKGRSVCRELGQEVQTPAPLPQTLSPLKPEMDQKRFVVFLRERKQGAGQFRAESTL
jgi:hypothetical protein